MRPNKTFIPKVSDLKRSWYIIDAEGLVLGRLAAIVANKLRGKDKVFFTPNMQCGDNIIIINSEKVLLKGQKRFNKNLLDDNNVIAKSRWPLDEKAPFMKGPGLKL